MRAAGNPTHADSQVITPFHCPYCEWVAALEMDGDSRVVVVCPGCAGYVARHADDWCSVSYADVGHMRERNPRMQAEMEEFRIQLVRRWVAGEERPPTLFAAVMADMVRKRGEGFLRWMPK